MIKQMQYEMPKSSYQIGTLSSCKYNLDDILEDPKLSFFIDENKESYFNEVKPTKLSDKEIVKIDEATRIQIMRDVDYARKQRAKHLTTYYQGVTNARGWIKFKTTSQYTPGLFYTQYVKLKEAKDMKYFKEFSKRDIIRLFLSGDLQVYCSCPDHKYRYKYLSYHKGFGLFKEMRYPKIRNPHLQGTVCKHMLCVLTYISANTMKIYRDMIKSKFFKKKAELEDDTGS